MDNYPEEYSKEAYITWHVQHVEPDIDLQVELTKIMDELKESSKERLSNLADLLYRIHSFHLLAKKTGKEDISDSDTDIQLTEAIQTEAYENLFKSVDSLIDKLWRKNKTRNEDTYITTKNIKHEIGDLVRSSVVTSTFSYAEHLATAIGLWKELIKELEVKEDDYSDIDCIMSQEEAKMENGYFAYHLDIRYKDDLRVEIQIYSKLSEIWRHLSHKLYEKIRLGEDVMWGHGAAASRLVSLGHLLHLAECEVQYLKEEMSK